MLQDVIIEDQRGATMGLEMAAVSNTGTDRLEMTDLQNEEDSLDMAPCEDQKNERDVLPELNENN